MKNLILIICCLSIISCGDDIKKCDLNHEVYEKISGNREILKTLDCHEKLLKSYEVLRISKDSVAFDGSYKEFFNDGRLSKIGFFKMNVQDSVAIVYREDGSKELDNYRVSGSLKGFQNYYDRNNRLTSQNYYLNDSNMTFKVVYNEDGSIKDFEGRALFIFYDKEPDNITLGESLFIGNEVPIMNDVITDIHIKLINESGEKKVDLKTQNFQFINNAYFKGVMFTPTAKGAYNYSAIVSLINKLDHSILKKDTMSFPILVK